MLVPLDSAGWLLNILATHFALHGNTIVVSGEASGLSLKPFGIALLIAKMMCKFFYIVSSALYWLVTKTALHCDPVSWMSFQPSAFALGVTEIIFSVFDLGLCALLTFTALSARNNNFVFGRH